MQHMSPAFFILGVNKCGTSSLYRYLVSHPNILPCAEKEPNFFGRHSPEYIESHINEYYALFPTRQYQGNLSFMWEASDHAGASPATQVQVERKPGANYITGEASANTFHDVPPSLLHQYLPDVKLILLIRDPVDRAYSHHRMYERFQKNGYDLGFDVKDFETDTLADLEARARGGKSNYICAGIYIDKLQDWVSQYGWEHIKVVITEELARIDGARRIMYELEDYLKIPHQDYGDFLSRRFNQAPPSDIAPGLRALLSNFYRPYNLRLQEYLRYELDWS